jgi:hypothetical protein
MTSETETADGITSFKTEVWPTTLPSNIPEDRLLASIAFLLLRYTANVSPKVKCVNQGGVISTRSWKIKENTVLRDLEMHFEYNDTPFDQDSSELSAWNPIFIQLADGKTPMDLVLEESHGNSLADLFFVVELGIQPSLGIFSSHRKHTQAFLRQMTKHWIQSLLLIETNASSLACTLPILTDEEYQQMVYTWNNTSRPSEEGKFDFEEFDKRVEQVPDKIAISSNRESLTYLQLQHRTNQIAHFLQSLGIGPEVLVGIYLPRSIDFVTCLVGLIKSGGAFLPLDPDHPQDRKEYMINDSRVPFIITSSALKNSLPKGNFEILVIDEFRSHLESFPKRTPVHGLQSGNMAYLFYTSGSTGQPKGVIMPHIYQDKKSQQELDESPIKDEKVLLKSSTGFTVILLETFTALKAGGEIVVVPKDREKDTRWLV